MKYPDSKPQGQEVTDPQAISDMLMQCPETTQKKQLSEKPFKHSRMDLTSKTH